MNPKASLQERIYYQAAEHPGAVALISGNQQWTHAEVNAVSNRIGHALLENGIGRDDFCVLFMSKSPELVLGMWGVIKSGAGFATLDPDLPQDRITSAWSVIRSRLVLTLGRHVPALLRIASALPALCDMRVVVLDDPAGTPWDAGEQVRIEMLAAYAGADGNLGIVSAVDDTPYIYFTSGTTGVPKGVVGRHLSIVHFVHWQSQTFGFGPGHRASQLTSIRSDAFLKDVLAPMCTGAAVCIPAPGDDVLSGAGLYDWLDRGRLTFVCLFPSLFKNLVWEAVARSGAGLGDLRHLVVSGEILSKELVKQWYEVFGERHQLVNMYGPTEVTVIKLCHFVSPADLERPSIPLGTPIKGSRVLILDDEQNPCAHGAVGEIYIQSPFLAKGYYERPDLTREAFLVNPLTGDPRDLVYKTGDLGRWFADGTLEFRGRVDDQVKILGNRIEIGDVESQIMALDEVKDVAVVARTDADGNAYLAAYVLPGTPIAVSALRSTLRRKLPASMLPARLVLVDEMPLTGNLKVDKEALVRRYPDDTGVADGDSEAPATPMETAMAGLWAQVLKKQDIGRYDDFFALGGNSLQVILLSARIFKKWGVRLQFGEVFEHSSLAALSAYLDGLSGDGFQDIPPAPPSAYYPLSHAQRRLWVIEKLDETSVAYNMTHAYLLEGALARESFHRALAFMQHKHESLRTCFPVVKGEPMQQILPAGELACEVLAMDGDAASMDERVAALYVQEAATPFDLERGPLFRVKLLVMGTERHVLLFTMHHIISDGWSMGVFLGDLLRAYQSLCTGTPHPEPALRIHYKDFAVWQNRALAESGSESRAYWLHKLANVPRLDLPTDFPRPPVMTFRGDTIAFSMDGDLAARIKGFAAESGCTTFMVLVAALKVLLVRYSGQNDVAVGTPVLGRNHPGLESQIGCYINSIALRTVLDMNASFAENLGRVRDTVVEAIDRQEYPFDRLVDELGLERDLSRNPVFDVLVVKDDDRVYRELERHAAGSGLRVSLYGQPPPVSKLDLSVAFLESDAHIGVAIEYRSDLFTADRIRRMGQHLEILFADICERGNTVPACTLALMPPEELAALERFSRNPVPGHDGDTIVAAFARIARACPERVAVTCGQASLTYAQLAAWSGRLAAALLRDHEPAPEEPVALLMGRSEKAIVATLGVLAAGCAYVPIDPANPVERIRYMLHDSGIRVVVVDDGCAHLLDSLEGVAALRIEATDETIGGAPDEAIVPEDARGRHPGPRSLAYVMYTSGSTGMPKGVMIEHAGVVNMVLGLQDILYRHCPTPLRVALTDSLHFDAGVQNLFCALLLGHTLCIASDEQKRDGRALCDFFVEERIDVSDGTPGLFMLLVDGGFAERTDMALRAMTLAGETLPAELVKDYYRRARHSPVVLYNIYGPTECSVNATGYRIDPAAAEGFRRIPIGQPLANYHIHVLDGRMAPVPMGVAGEIYIGGVGVARGYVSKPALTAERFMPSPFLTGDRLYRTGDIGAWNPDGTLDFATRRDDQVKIRGFRIELAEIEEHLRRHPALSDAVVLVRGSELQDKELLAYVVRDAAAEQPMAAELRRYLAEMLPDYMIPAFYVPIEHVPLNQNGKIDKRALPDVDTALDRDRDYVAPTTAAEAHLVAIWETLFSRRPIGIDDDFFELGGHSLKAMRMVNLVQERLGASIALRDVFLHPTIRGLAMRMVAGEEMSIPRVAPAAHYPLSHAQKRLWIISQLDKDSPAYCISHAYLVEGSLQPAAFRRAMEALIERHESLRTSFVTVGGEPMQQIHDAIPAPLEHVDLTAYPDAETRAARWAADETVRPMDVESVPLFRATLLTLDEQRHVLIFTFHHIICDGWSVDILLGDLRSAYEAFAAGHENPLPPLRIQYKDYAAWHNAMIERDRERFLGYWRSKLAKPLPVLRLPTDFPRPAVKTSSGRQIGFRFDRELTEKIRAFDTAHGSTLFITLLTVLDTLLYRYTGQEDIIVGTPVAGRNHRELEGQIGFFINDLVLRNRVRGDMTFLDALAAIKASTLEAYDYQEYPFDALVDGLGHRTDRSRFPIYDISFNIDQVEQELDLYAQPGEPRQGALQIRGFGAKEEYVLQPDMILYGKEEKEAISFSIIYNTGLFEAKSISRLFEGFRRIAEQACDDPSITLAAIRLDEPDEQDQAAQSPDIGFDFDF